MSFYFQIMIAASNRQSLQYAGLPSDSNIQASLPFTVFLCVNSCNVAFVELRDGATVNSELINTFCKGLPSSQYTTGNMLYVRFFTDAPDPKNGFKANVNIGKIQFYFYCSHDNGHKRKGNVRDHRARIPPPS
jgi:hypothetical protein